MPKPIVRTFWRAGNSLAIIESAKHRLREANQTEQALKLTEDIAKLPSGSSYETIIKVVKKYCDVQ